ncbi:MAG: DUF2490 domain-containing protein [Candidatus Omnitrophota bacterium]|nr:MAG: DUF2490 domain-containing protein [Candidatus Omnitrophota bacterium]
MAKIVKKNLLTIVLFFTAFSGNCYAFDNGDFQYWNTESVSWKPNDDWKTTLEEEFRLGDDGGNLYYQHSDLSVTYSGFSPWFDLGLNYRHIFEKKDSKWKVENRPHLNATLKWELYDLGFSNRGRLEYRNRENADNFWRYRNKFTIKIPFKLTKLEIQPYIAGEIFYDFDVGTLNRNRLYSGFNFKLSKNLKANIFYLWQTTEKSYGWNDVHVLGTKFNISF